MKGNAHSRGSERLASVFEPVAVRFYNDNLILIFVQMNKSGTLNYTEIIYAVLRVQAARTRDIELSL